MTTIQSRIKTVALLLEEASNNEQLREHNPQPFQWEDELLLQQKQLKKSNSMSKIFNFFSNSKARKHRHKQHLHCFADTENVTELNVECLELHIFNDTEDDSDANNENFENTLRTKLRLQHPQECKYNVRASVSAPSLSTPKLESIKVNNKGNIESDGKDGKNNKDNDDDNNDNDDKGNIESDGKDGRNNKDNMEVPKSIIVINNDNKVSNLISIIIDKINPVKKVDNKKKVSFLHAIEVRETFSSLKKD
eukprot:Pgem_evm1s1946